MLAYVFWHWPAPSVDRDAYAEALLAFHRALLAEPPAGMRGSRVFALDAAPWVPAERPFEDWYLLDDFAALGALNEAAVSGASRTTRRRGSPPEAREGSTAGCARGRAPPTWRRGSRSLRG